MFRNALKLVLRLLSHVLGLLPSTVVLEGLAVHEDAGGLDGADGEEEEVYGCEAIETNSLALDLRYWLVVCGRGHGRESG